MLKECQLITIFFIIVVPTIAHCDYMVDFIRISCIRETRFLDIEYRPIHNNAVDVAPDDSNTRGKDIWAKHGFFNPGKLSFECSLPESEYKVVATQNSWSERGMCGTAPEIIFSLYRNNEAIIKNVVFGSSCFGNNSITRISIQDGKRGWYIREAEICFQKLTNESTHKCRWFFEGLGTSIKPFPIEQKSIENIIKD